MEREDKIKLLIVWLLEAGIPFQERVEIARLSQIKAGGVFRLMVKPARSEHLSALLVELNSRALPYKVVGNLSNVLFRDGEIWTIGISTRGLRELSFTEDGVVTVGAGVMLPTLATKLVQAGYRGFAGLIGVPASVGGAVFMNASCYGDATSDYLLDVEYIDKEGQIQSAEVADLNFSWRHSAFHDRLAGGVIISARFRPVAGETESELEREREIRSLRRSYQENEFPNLGSTFATKDIYADLAKRFWGYKLGLLFIRLLVRLKQTSLSDGYHRFPVYAVPFTKLYFHLVANHGVDFSKSTFNCVVNLGGAKADDLIAFILKTDRAIDQCVRLEVELLKDIE